MALPHVSMVQRFASQVRDELEASVAFGLFMTAEREWAEHQGNPTDGKYRNYQMA
jgi:hypothetical protein